MTFFGCVSSTIRCQVQRQEFFTQECYVRFKHSPGVACKLCVGLLTKAWLESMFKHKSAERFWNNERQIFKGYIKYGWVVSTMWANFFFFFFLPFMNIVYLTTCSHSISWNQWFIAVASRNNQASEAIITTYSKYSILLWTEHSASIQKG